MTSIKNKMINKKLFFSIFIILSFPFFVNFLGLFGILSPDPLHIFLHFGDHSLQFLDGSPGWVDPNSGATTQSLGALAAREWLSGHIPWWDSYSGMGLPLAAEMQSSALFFPFILLLQFSNGVLYLKIAMQVMAGFAMFGLLREMRVSHEAATVGAILGELSGTFAWFAHGPIMPLPFLPLFLWGVFRCCKVGEWNRLTGFLLVSLALAGSILAGFPETAYMNGLLVLLVSIWRVITLGRNWWRSTLLICGGGLAGIALSAPAWIPFVDLLSVGFLGQNQNYHDAHMLAANWGMTLFPYLFGPPLYATSGGVPQIVDVWWHTGGYCDIGLLFLSLIGVVYELCNKEDKKSKFRGLRLLLLGYLIVTILKAVGFLPVSRLVDIIPGIKQTMFYVYISPGWWCALCILAVLSLDDLLLMSSKSRNRAVSIAIGCVFTVAVVALVRSRHHIAIMLNHPGYIWYPLVSVLWGIFILYFLSVGVKKSSRIMVSSIIILNSVALFFFPTLTGVRADRPDTQALAFMKNITHDHRLLSVSAFSPNYGAFYGIPTIDYTYLPLPEDFASALDQHVCPGYDHTQFFPVGLGRFCAASSGERSFEDWLKPSVSVRDGLQWLEDHNVGYILHPQNYPILRDRVATPITSHQYTYRDFGNHSVEGTLDNQSIAGSALQRVGVGLGTYNAHAKGIWHVSVCGHAGCSVGHGRLEDAADNQLSWLTLDRPLVLEKTETAINYRIWAETTDHPAALAFWSEDTGGIERTHPLVAIEFDTFVPGLERVFADNEFVIDKLPYSVNYYTSSECDVKFLDRQHAYADCKESGELLRHELNYPEWSVTVNGQTSKVETAKDGISQVVALPAGKSNIYFSYQPRHMSVIITLFFGSCVIVILCFFKLSIIYFSSRKTLNFIHE